MIKTLFTESWKGKSLSRILLNEELKNLTLTGDVLDLGSGSSQPSYLRHFKQKNAKITLSDLEGKNMLKIDLNKPFNLKKKYDIILCFNTLEHVYNFQNVFKEAYKALKDGGLFIISVPFLFKYHADPQDYWRFTHTALKTLAEESKFKVISNIQIGKGPFTASQWVNLIPKAIRPFVHSWHIILDKALIRFSNQNSNNYALLNLLTLQK